jgi:hypothetical protein
MRNPDLGQHLWAAGFADKPVIVIGAGLQLAAEAPGGTRDVSFNVTWDDGVRYCGTLNTRQTAQAIMGLVASGKPLAIEGRLAKGTVTGQGGERYRLIVGALRPLDGAAEAVPDLGAISRQQRRAIERQQRKGR